MTAPGARKATIVWALACAASACGSRHLGGGGGTGGSGGSSADASGTGDYITNICAQPLGPTMTPSTVADLRAKLPGRWASCGQPTLFGLSWPGFQVASDDTWHFLAASTGDALVPEYGVDVQGTVSYVQDTGDVSVTFTLLPSQMMARSVPAFGVGSSVLTLGQDESGHPIRYVWLPPGAYELPDAGAGPAVDATTSDASPAVDAAEDGPPPNGVIACRNDSDCTYGGMQCFIDAVMSACPTDPIGHCYYVAPGNCPFVELEGAVSGGEPPCVCLGREWEPTPTSAYPCGDIPNATCQRIFPLDGGVKCSRCVLSTDATAP